MEIFISIGERLREEREAMGKTQSDFAGIAAAAGVPGATRQSQAKYEKGLASPSAAYLSAVALQGVDVRYVLTGEREVPQELVLNAEEKTLLSYFRSASTEIRRAALGALTAGASTQFEGSQQIFHKAPKGDIAGRDIVKGGGKR
ncbi:transcriptional regulator [Acidovorax sp. HMWF018]|nr:transcriptional regulator [Acidovorax sp. HMWF018]